MTCSITALKLVRITFRSQEENTKFLDWMNGNEIEPRVKIRHSDHVYLGLFGNEDAQCIRSYMDLSGVRFVPFLFEIGN